ncbi:UNVERIFIED_ORG: type I restriction enzyme S subunit [Martelella mediterranea]
MTERLWDIPTTWEWTVIKELGDVVSGGTPSTKVPEYWGGDVIWFAPSDLTGYKSKTITRGAKSLTDDGLANSSAKVMPAGSVMFSSRAPVGYVAINTLPAATNQGFKSIVPLSEIDGDFLYHYLKASKQLAEERATGTTFKELSGSAFGVLPVPVAPTNEQRRIVERIEAMFDEIDHGVENLKKAKATLGLYRQSLLKSAFEGRLTADWRARNADKLESPETLLARIRSERDAHYQAALDDWQKALTDWRDNGEEGKKPPKPRRPKDFIGSAIIPDGNSVEVPSSWHVLPMFDLGQISGGLTKNQKRNALPIKAKYLRVANVYSNRLDLDEIMEIGVTKDELDKTRLEEGDLLFVEGNGSIDQIGRVAVWDGSICDMSHQNHLIRFSPDGALASRFALYFMMSPRGRKLIEAQASSTSGLHTLSISKIEGLPIPICSVEEQAEITRILDERLSAADALEAEIDAGLTRAEALRQSILKQAFSGKLVSQDPSDEPAADLLARIKAEKATKPKAPRKRKAIA